MVRFSPTWTVTFCPFTSNTVFPFRYQPSDPVENSRASASMGLPPIVTSTGLAPSRNWARVIGQLVLAMFSLLVEWLTTGHLTGRRKWGKQRRRAWWRKPPGLD